MAGRVFTKCDNPICGAFRWLEQKYNPFPCGNKNSDYVALHCGWYLFYCYCPKVLRYWFFPLRMKLGKTNVIRRKICSNVGATACYIFVDKCYLVYSKGSSRKLFHWLTEWPDLIDWKEKMTSSILMTDMTAYKVLLNEVLIFSFNFCIRMGGKRLTKKLRLVISLLIYVCICANCSLLWETF